MSSGRNAVRAIALGVLLTLATLPAMGSEPIDPETDKILKSMASYLTTMNTIDASALESLEAINHRLKDGGVTFHLSEVKGAVLDRLKRSHFLEELTGKVHLTHYDAVSSINPELARRTLEAERSNPAAA